MKKLALFMACLCVIAAVCACDGNAQNGAGTTAANADGENSQNSVSENADDTGLGSDDDTGMADVIYKDEDLDETWDNNAVRIVLDDDNTTVDGKGAIYSDGSVTIKSGGTYVISGTLTDGQILVDAGKEDLVHLVFNGINVINGDGAAVVGRQSDKMVITLAEGTENKLSDGENYIFDDDADEPDAALFSKDDLTINGSGKLIVNGNYKDGIRSKNDLKIISGVIDVTAVGDGIFGKDSVAVKDGQISVCTGNDGIKVTNDVDADKGYIVLEGGDIKIEAGGDGIQAERILQVTGGNYTLFCGQGSDIQVKNAEESQKGLKAGAGLYVTGGTVNIDASDDAIHCNGNVHIQGGEMMLKTGDDGIHADSSLEVFDGVIYIEESYEGLEGLTVDISGGTLEIYASDDGLNAAGGSDGLNAAGGSDGLNAAGGSDGENEQYGDGNEQSSGEIVRQGDGNEQHGGKMMVGDAKGFGRGMDMFDYNEDAWIKISGGYMYINASGDGIDSNGNLYISGGVILVDGPEDGGNGALDYSGTAIIDGGVIVAVGSSQMAQGFTEESGQPSLRFDFTQIQQAGTMVNISEAEGQSILSYVPSKAYQSLVISTPDFEVGKTYIVSSGGRCEGESQNGYYSGEVYEDGEKVVEVTLENIVTAITSDGSKIQGGMMGQQPMNGGNMKENGDMEPPNGENMEMPEGLEPPDGKNMEMPEGLEPPDGENMEMPEGLEP